MSIFMTDEKIEHLVLRGKLMTPQECDHEIPRLEEQSLQRLRLSRNEWQLIYDVSVFRCKIAETKYKHFYGVNRRDVELRKIIQIQVLFYAYHKLSDKQLQAINGDVAKIIEEPASQCWVHTAKASKSALGALYEMRAMVTGVWAIWSILKYLKEIGPETY